VKTRRPTRLTDTAARLAGMHTLRCPDPGCTVRIRFRAITQQEITWLTALANDHTRHGAKR
jgi:hypothetical protein